MCWNVLSCQSWNSCSIFIDAILNCCNVISIYITIKVSEFSRQWNKSTKLTGFLFWTIQTFLSCPVSFFLKKFSHFNYFLCSIMHLNHVAVPEYHTGQCAGFNRNSYCMSTSQWFSSWCWRLCSGLYNNLKKMILEQNAECGLLSIFLWTPLDRADMLLEMLESIPYIFRLPVDVGLLNMFCLQTGGRGVISLCSSPNQTQKLWGLQQQHKHKKLATKNVRGHVLSFWKLTYGTAQARACNVL